MWDDECFTHRSDCILCFFFAVAPRSAELVLPYGLHLSQWIPNVIIKLGEDGCLFVGRSNVSNRSPVIRYFSPEQFDQTSIISVTGAGDRLVNDEPITPCIDIGHSGIIVLLVRFLPILGIIANCNQRIRIRGKRSLLELNVQLC